jgi:hypothetical protein
LPVGRELVLCAAVAALSSVLVLEATPPGGDLAAHLYRTLLAREGVWVWDNLWFAGQYPLFSYSLLYYLAASVVGNTVLGVGSIVAAAVLFCSLALREWGAVARWPVRSFALLGAGQLFTAAYPFDAGVASMLGSVWALQRGRVIVGLAFAAFTLGFSPLAFLFLLLVVAALWLRSRQLNRRVLLLVVALVATAAAELGVLVLFPSGQLVYPYGLWRLFAGLAVAGSSAALAARRRAHSLTMIFVVWAAASVVAYLVPSAVGHNILRASTFVFPLSLLAGAMSGFRPRWLALPAVAGAFLATVVPYLSMIPARSSTAGESAAFWQPMIRFLAARSGPDFRVEVVPTANHWEAYYLPRAGFALARGWYRQLDIADNPVFYRRPLTPESYRGWLRSEGVKYVIVPHAPLEAVDAPGEAALVRSGRSSLRRVWSDANGTIYAVPHPQAILSGPGRSTISSLSSSRIVGRVARPGRYVLRVHFTPYWRVSGAVVCVQPAGTTRTTLELGRAGRFVLRADETPGTLISQLLDPDARHCA